MNRGYALLATLRIVMVVLAVCGCAERPLRKPPPPKVWVGPEIHLTKEKTDRVRAVIDSAGRAHILLRQHKSNGLNHIEVGLEGVIDQDTIAPSASEHYDIGVGREGRLHVIGDGGYWIKDGGLWRACDKHPWGSRDTQVKHPKFTHDGQDLVCAFIVSGHEVGAPRRWDWYGIGYDKIPLIIFPWYVKNIEKLVLVREMDSGWSGWTVLEPDSISEVDSFSLSQNRKGTIHVAYGVHGRAVVVGRREETRYARVERELTPANYETTALADMELGREARPFNVVQGRLILEWCPDEEGFDIAADPESEDALFGLCAPVNVGEQAYGVTYLIHDLLFEQPKVLSLGHWTRGPILASAGEGRFHAIVVRNDGAIVYLLYSSGLWSAPVELATMTTTQYLFGEAGAVYMVSNQSCRALAIWPSQNGMSARWIELVE